MILQWVSKNPKIKKYFYEVPSLNPCNSSLNPCNFSLNLWNTHLFKIPLIK
jgi:hypothetical protein